MPSRSPCPSYPPLSTPRIFGILSIASKGFFTKKNNTPTNRKIFLFFTKPVSPASNSPAPNFCSKSRIYRQLDTPATQRQQSYNLHIFGIDFFFRPPYIVLEVVNENLFDVLVGLFCRGQTKIFVTAFVSSSCYYFRENKSILRSFSPFLRLGFPTLCFPDLLSKNKPTHSFSNPPRCGFCAAVTGLFFLPERAGASSYWFSLVLGWYLGGRHGRNS